MDAALLKEIHTREKGGTNFTDIVEHLRLRCVPQGYTSTPWSLDTALVYIICFHFFCVCLCREAWGTLCDKLKSIVAQLEYSHQVIKYDNAGIPFCTYMYVAEVHPITWAEYLEREDDAHLLKVN